jgi:ATP-dependent Clp protease protease subunit
MNKIIQLYKDNKALISKPLNFAKNKDNGEASLYIYDVIDAYWGVSAVSVIDALAQIGDATTLNVYLNTPGGDVFEGRAIMAAIQRFNGKSIAHVDSLCASAGTSIALSCDEVEMSEGALFMIHNASGMAWGDKTAMRETANLLEKVEGSIITDYTTKTGKSSEEIAAMMEAETWMTAKEALDNGFIDRIAPAKTGMSNVWNLSAYANAPKQAEPEAIKPIENQISELVHSEEKPYCATQTNQNKLALALI